MSSPELSNPAYRIETKRLVVRCYNPSDAVWLAESVTESIEHLRPWMPWVHNEPEPIEEKVQRLKRFRGMFDLGQDFIYGIFNQDDTKLLGGTGLHTRLGESELEIGYWIHKDFINQGLVTESTAALSKLPLKSFMFIALKFIAIPPTWPQQPFHANWVLHMKVHCVPKPVSSIAGAIQ
jgi:RimJ/RimL family protein N-acetyltransferase